MQTDLRWLFDGLSLFSVLSCMDGHAIVEHNLFALLDVLLVDDQDVQQMPLDEQNTRSRADRQGSAAGICCTVLMWIKGDNSNAMLAAVVHV